MVSLVSAICHVSLFTCKTTLKNFQLGYHLCTVSVFMSSRLFHHSCLTGNYLCQFNDYFLGNLFSFTEILPHCLVGLWNYWMGMSSSWRTHYGPYGFRLNTFVFRLILFSINPCSEVLFCFLCREVVGGFPIIPRIMWRPEFNIQSLK